MTIFPLPSSFYKSFSMQLGTIITYFYLLVTAKFPFAPFTTKLIWVKKTIVYYVELELIANNFLNKLTSSIE